MVKNSPANEGAAAAAAKSLQSCPTLCDPRDNSPPGSPVPGILQARTMKETQFQSLGWEESDTTEKLHFHALEKEMAPHSSVLAWRIPGTGEPGGLSSMGSHRVGHD